MLFRIRTVSGVLVQHPLVVAKTDPNGFYQEIELRDLDDLLELQKSVKNNLIISEDYIDNSGFPLIRVYDDYLD